MGKIANVQQARTADLIAYERNAKKHGQAQVEKIARSIQEFGFISPLLIDRQNNIIAGHGRVLAAEALGLETVPCVYVEGLTDEQRRAYILADNKLTELGGWDDALVSLELEDLALAGFDVDVTGFEVPSGSDWFETRARYDNDNEDESEEYQAFVEKFEPKRTTDDCYTPDEVYEAVASWVADTYRLDRATFFRPFYPGGDYTRENYAGKVVVDNPPFSILSEILNFYGERGIRFFLFAPALTLFSSSGLKYVTAIPLCVGITYENNAAVSTSFLTNLEPEEVQARTSHSLYKAIKDANNEARKNRRAAVELPKYYYPDEVVTATFMGRCSKYGVELTILRKQCEQIEALDAQREAGKAVFGKGLILSEKAAAEKAAAEKAAAEKAAATRWQLSEREKEIVRRLSENDDD